MDAKRKPHPAMLDEEALLAQCDLARGRGSGPGGQHRNKVETRVTITHVPTGVSAQASERRSLNENRAVAIQRLRLALATHHRELVPNGDQRTELWITRCRNRKIACNPRHADYPALLAEALDTLAATDWDHTVAAARLGCSASQLWRLIAHHPQAVAVVNRERGRIGLHPLR